MSRMLSFTPEVYLSLFEQYNRAIWPIQFLAYGLGFFALLFAFRPAPQRDRVVGVVLAAAWLWTGAGYHFLYFTQINFVAPVFALLFVLQGLLLAGILALRGQVAFRFHPDLFGWAGLAVAGFAMVGHPLLEWLAGHGWPRSAVFGLTPNPTTIFTWGMLLLVQGRTPLRLTVIPLIWSAIAGAMAWLLMMPDDASLPIIAIAAFALILWKNRLAARTAAPTAGESPTRRDQAHPSMRS